MEVVALEFAVLQQERAALEAERRRMVERQQAVEQQHAKERAELTELVEDLRNQANELEARPASSQGASSAGVRPSDELLGFMDEHGLEHLDSYNEEGWNLLHLAATATMKYPGMVPLMEEMLRFLPTEYLAEETLLGQPIGFTPLHLLCQGVDPWQTRQEAIALLIAAKAPLEARNNNGATPLLLAAGSAFTDAVRVLWHAKADINAANFKGKTAFDLAKATSRHACIDVLQMGGRSGHPPPQPPARPERGGAGRNHRNGHRKRRHEELNGHLTGAARERLAARFSRPMVSPRRSAGGR